MVHSFRGWQANTTIRGCLASVGKINLTGSNQANFFERVPKFLHNHKQAFLITQNAIQGLPRNAQKSVSLHRISRFTERKTFIVSYSLTGLSATE